MVAEVLELLSIYIVHQMVLGGARRYSQIQSLDAGIISRAEYCGSEINIAAARDAVQIFEMFRDLWWYLPMTAQTTGFRKFIEIPKLTKYMKE